MIIGRRHAGIGCGNNELNMEISRCILEDSGMEVTCAVDGQEAVEIFEKSAPDYFGVIYMDIICRG